MGNGCKQIDWDKPIRGVSSRGNFTVTHRKLASNAYLTEWAGVVYGFPMSAIVDAQGHCIWHCNGDIYKGEHLVENVPEERREWLVFCKDANGEWDYLRCGIMPWTSSYADKKIAEFKEYGHKDKNYIDFAKVRYSPNMHGRKE